MHIPSKARFSKTIGESFEKMFHKVIRYRFYIAYTILASLVIYAWWTNVVSVYVVRSSSSQTNFQGTGVSKGLPPNTDKVVVLSCLFELYTTPSLCLFKEVCGCSYWLPVSVLAWRRFGYKALVLLIGHLQGEQSWKRRNAFHYAIEMMERIGGVQIEEIDVADETFYQTAEKMAHLFAGKFIAKNGGNPYVIFADVNLFPLSQAYFEPDEGHENGMLVVSTLSRCCRRFLLSGNVIKLLPDGTMVGMLASTWREILGNILEAEPSEKEDAGEKSNTNDSLPEITRLFNKYIGRRSLNQIKASPDKLILSILINEWLRSKGDVAAGIEKKLLTIRQPPRYGEKQQKAADDTGIEEEEEDEGGNLFREFPITAQTISGWSEVYPVAAELFDPAWLDLTEYWINFTNIVNSEPNIHLSILGGSSVTSSLVNGVNFFPLILTPPPAKTDDSENDIIGNDHDKQEDFQYVAFFDEDEK